MADIADESGITEIQTANFGKMRKKLELFLANSPVRLVYPVAKVKWIVWLNQETGEVSQRHKSPKRNSEYQVFREIYSLGDLIFHPNFRLTLALLETEELRLLNGWSKNKKSGASKHEAFPLRLLGEIELRTALDYLQFIPKSLPESFTSRDFQKAARLSEKQTFYCINALRKFNQIEQIGKEGRAYLYKIM